MFTFTFPLLTKVLDFQQFDSDQSTVRIALQNMTDEEVLKHHWESGDEMLKRNMVGAEIWQTADGVITNGCKEAREAILKIYEDAQTGFQQMLDDCALKAARSSDIEVPQSNPVCGPFQVSQPPKMDRPLSAMNEKQMSNYAVVIINHQRLSAGQRKKKIEWGNTNEKPPVHPDEMVKWEDFTKTPRNMSATEFESIAIEDPVEFPIAPFKPQKAHYYRQLIKNMLTSMKINPETHYDKALFTNKKKKDLSKGLANRIKHRLPVLPTREQRHRASTPEQFQEVLRRSLSAGTSRLTRRSLSTVSSGATRRPTFIPAGTPINPPELPSFDGDETEELSEYENIRASNIAEREALFRNLDIEASLEAVKEARYPEYPVILNICHFQYWSP